MVVFILTSMLDVLLHTSLSQVADSEECGRIMQLIIQNGSSSQVFNFLVHQIYNCYYHLSTSSFDYKLIFISMQFHKSEGYKKENLWHLQCHILQSDTMTVVFVYSSVLCDEQLRCMSPFYIIDIKYDCSRHHPAPSWIDLCSLSTALSWIVGIGSFTSEEQTVRSV